MWENDMSLKIENKYLQNKSLNGAGPQVLKKKKRLRFFLTTINLN